MVALSAIFPATAPTAAATSESLRLSPAASWTWNVAPGGTPGGTATVYVCCVAGSVNCTFEPGAALCGTDSVRGRAVVAGELLSLKLLAAYYATP